MDDQEIWHTVSEIINRYQLMECDRCAIASVAVVKRKWNRGENSEAENQKTN
jgi:hypothetical protein